MKLVATGRVLLRQSTMLVAGTVPLAWPSAGQLPVGLYVVRLSQAGRHATLRVVRE